MSARHNRDARALLWVSFSKRFREKNVLNPSGFSSNCRSWEHVVFASIDRVRLPTLFFNPFFTLLKLPCANRNHRCKLYSTKSSKKELSKWTKKKENENKKEKIHKNFTLTWTGSNHRPIIRKSLNFQVRHEGPDDHVGRRAYFVRYMFFSSNSPLLPEPIRCLE